MGIHWSSRQSPADGEEFPFNLLNLYPNRTRSAHRPASPTLDDSSWNLNGVVHMSNGENSDSRTGNNNNVDRTSVESDLDDRGDESFATLLSSLIRSGHVQLISAGGACSADDDPIDVGGTRSSGSNDQESEAMSMSNEDRLKVNDIQTIGELDCGQFALFPSTAASRRNILKRLRDRECGGLTRRSASSAAEYFTRGDKCYVGNCMLPNSMSKIDTYRSKAFCGQYTRDGQILITACQDQRIRFYDVSKLSDCGRSSAAADSDSDCEPEPALPCHEVEAKDVGWSVLDVAVSPDGRHAVYSSWSDYIHQCSVQDDQDTNHVAFNLHPGEYRFCVFSLRFSTDGSEILAGASDRGLYVYDRIRNIRSLKIDAHEDDVNAVCFADDSSQIIYSGGDDGLCKVWDRRTLSEESPKPVGVLAGHSDGITFIDSKCDARYLISNCKDQSIKLWDIRRFSDEDAVRATRAAVSRQSWDYRWQNVPKKVVKYRPLHGDTSVMTYRGHHTVLHTLVRCFFSPEFTTGQRFIYTGCAQGACVVYDVLTGKVVKKLRGHQACVRDVSWHPYRNEICTSSWDAVIGRWTYDGRSESDDEDESFRDPMELGEEDTRNAGSNYQTIAGRLVNIYRRRLAGSSLRRRSNRLREQEMRRMHRTD